MLPSCTSAAQSRSQGYRDRSLAGLLSFEEIFLHRTMLNRHPSLTTHLPKVDSLGTGVLMLFETLS